MGEQTQWETIEKGGMIIIIHCYKPLKMKIGEILKLSLQLGDVVCIKMRYGQLRL
jgi:hypothetical protein